MNPRGDAARRRADTLWREYIFRQGWCQVCGVDRGLEPHHLIGRGQKSVRHDPMNGLLLCVAHHTGDGKPSAHGTPKAFRAWLREHLPNRAAWMEEAKRAGAGRVDYVAAAARLEKALDS